MVWESKAFLSRAFAAHLAKPLVLTDCAEGQSGEQLYQFIAKARLPRHATGPTIDFRPKVAKQHDVSPLRYTGVTIFEVLMSARAVS